jgi:prepilin-type N-terminal cleavage/methylation domain-containing protein
MAENPHMTQRGFSVFEVTITMAILAIASGAALPTATAIAHRRAERAQLNETSAQIQGARDRAYKTLECIDLSITGSTTLRWSGVPCSASDAVLPGSRIVELDPALVREVSFVEPGALVFQPNGGLDGASVSPPRFIRVELTSGKLHYFEVQPAIGTISECKEVAGLLSPSPTCIK